MTLRIVAILDGLDHVIGHIRARDFETENRQVALSHAVLSGVRLVCELGRAHHRPVEFAFHEDAPWQMRRQRSAEKTTARESRLAA